MILALCSALGNEQRHTSGMLCPDLGSSGQERPGAPGAGPAEAAQIRKGMEQLSHKDRLRGLRLFSLEETQLRGDLIPVCREGSEQGPGSAPWGPAMGQETTGKNGYPGSST